MFNKEIVQVHDSFFSDIIRSSLAGVLPRLRSPQRDSQRSRVLLRARQVITRHLRSGKNTLLKTTDSCPNATGLRSSSQTPKYKDSSFEQRPSRLLVQAPIQARHGTKTLLLAILAGSEVPRVRVSTARVVFCVLPLQLRLLAVPLLFA